MDKSIKHYYKGLCVAIAGGAGMVGHKLASQLVECGADVLVIDDFSRGRNIIDGASYLVNRPSKLPNKYDPVIVSGNHARILAGMYSHKRIGTDVSVPEGYAHVLRGYDIVFNLAAAVAGVLHNQNHHTQMFYNNVKTLAGPLIASELAGVRAFGQTSSVCVYSESNQCPCDEYRGWGEEPHEANAGYAYAKRNGERIAVLSGIERVVIFRPSNIIGQKDYYDHLAHVVPAFVKRAVELVSEDRFIAYGSGNTQREFIFSEDVASGMLYAMASGNDREAYNIGTSTGSLGKENVIRMETLAYKILGIVANKTGKENNAHVVFDRSSGGGDMARYSDASRLRALGWKHKWGLNDALDAVVDDYLESIREQE